MAVDPGTKGAFGVEMCAASVWAAAASSDAVGIPRPPRPPWPPRPPRPPRPVSPGTIAVRDTSRVTVLGGKDTGAAGAASSVAF